MRQYLVGSWNNADSYDYSGEMLLGNRHKGRSICADHVLPDGKANLSRYADPETPKKTKKSIPIAHQITPQSRTLDKLDTQELALHKAYKSDEVSLEEYEELLYALDQKRERAFKSLCKALGRQETGAGDYPVSQGGYNDKTLNTYDKALTKGSFGANMQGIGSSFSKSMKKDTIYFLLASILGCSMLMYLTN